MSALLSPFLAVVLVLAILVALELGRALGRWQRRRSRGGPAGSTGVIDGAVFALLGLLIAFTFTGAAGRFDARRHLIVEETNALGTAYLRVDLLPAGSQPAIRRAFADYLDARIEFYEVGTAHGRFDEETTTAEARFKEGQRTLWSLAVAACAADPRPSTSTLLLPPLNDAFDIAAERLTSISTHPPTLIFVVLFGLVLIAAVLAGHGLAGEERRRWLHLVAFALVMALSTYVILDLEYPRIGLLRVESFDRLLSELRAEMGQGSSSAATP